MDPGNQVSGDRARYDSKAAGLLGRRVLEARYWDVHNFTDEPQVWDYIDWHHAVMGVELQTDRGPSCVLWTSTFCPYGVEVFHTPMSEHIVAAPEGPGSRDVSSSSRWRDRLESPVQEVQAFWERVIDVDVPVALRIDFAVGPVWMVAAIPQMPEMQEAFVPGDEIMVVFTPERMRQIGFPDSEFLT